MSPYWTSDGVDLYLGDCRTVMAGLEADSFDAVVCNPPYDLTSGKKGGTGAASLNPDSPAGRSRIGTGGGFMGQSWDATGVAFDPETWRAVYRVMKPGAWLVAFGGTRTWHRLACAIEDAGFEIRDSIHWVYGGGFPKSLDVSKAIDKTKRRDYVLAAVDLGIEIPGNNLHDWTKAEHSPGDEWWEKFKACLPVEEWQRIEREVIGRAAGGEKKWREIGAVGISGGDYDITAPATDDAAAWEGWGTALKPAHEPIVLARKPLAGTVAQNVLAYGTGALNIDACRVKTADGLSGGAATKGSASHEAGWDRPWKNDPVAVAAHASRVAANVKHAEALGRWPSNVLFSHSADCEPAGVRHVRSNASANKGSGLGYKHDVDRPRGSWGDGPVESAEAWICQAGCPVAELDRQSAGMRAAKPSRTGSNGAHATVYSPSGTGYAGTAPEQSYGDSGGASRFFPVFKYEAKAGASERPRLPDGTAHSTVKPVDLMSWLVRLVTKRGGRVLDPFAGSGPTGQACLTEGRECVLIELRQPFADLVKVRLAKPIAMSLFDTEEAV